MCSFPNPSMPNRSHDDMLLLEMEIDRLRLAIARERAEEIVKDLGWSEDDVDYLFQVEIEARRQWEEDCEREMERSAPWDDIAL